MVGVHWATGCLKVKTGQGNIALNTSLDFGPRDPRLPGGDRNEDNEDVSPLGGRL